MGDASCPMPRRDCRYPNVMLWNAVAVSLTTRIDVPVTIGAAHLVQLGIQVRRDRMRRNGAPVENGAQTPISTISDGVR